MVSEVVNFFVWCQFCVWKDVKCSSIFWLLVLAQFTEPSLRKHWPLKVIKCVRHGKKGMERRNSKSFHLTIKWKSNPPSTFWLLFSSIHLAIFVTDKLSLGWVSLRISNIEMKLIWSTGHLIQRTEIKSSHNKAGTSTYLFYWKGILWVEEEGVK